MGIQKDHRIIQTDCQILPSILVSKFAASDFENHSIEGSQTSTTESGLG